MSGDSSSGPREFYSASDGARCQWNVQPSVLLQLGSQLARRLGRNCGGLPSIPAMWAGVGYSKCLSRALVFSLGRSSSSGYLYANKPTSHYIDYAAPNLRVVCISFSISSAPHVSFRPAFRLHWV